MTDEEIGVLMKTLQGSELYKKSRRQGGKGGK
jgi:hypothetical protein